MWQYLANEREKVLQHLNFTAQLAAPYDQALVDPELKAVGKGKGKVMLEVNAPNQHVEEYRTLYSGKGKNWFDPTDPPFPMQASAPKGYRAKAKSWTQDLAQTDSAATLLAKEKKRVHELKSALIEEAVKAHMKERKLENGLVREAVVAHRRKNELLNAQPQMATAHKAQTKKLASFWKHPGMDKGGVFGAIKPEHALTPEYLSQPLYTDETNEVTLHGLLRLSATSLATLLCFDHGLLLFFRSSTSRRSSQACI